MGGNEAGYHPVAGCKYSYCSLDAADAALVCSGASATIVSDAVMNPFDGKSFKFAGLSRF